MCFAEEEITFCILLMGPRFMAFIIIIDECQGLFLSQESDGYEMRMNEIEWEEIIFFFQEWEGMGKMGKEWEGVHWQMCGREQNKMRWSGKDRKGVMLIFKEQEGRIGKDEKEWNEMES